MKRFSVIKTNNSALIKKEVKSMENNKWERFIEILISPEIALLLAVLAVLMNLYLIYLNHIDSYML